MNTVESTPVTFSIKYALTDEYRKERFAETGKRPDRTQTLDVSAEDVPASVRKRLYDLADVGSTRSSGDISKTVSLRVPENKIHNSRTVGSVRRTYERLSDYPELQVPTSRSTAGQYMKFSEPLTADMLGEALDRREDLFELKRTEHVENLDEAAPRLLHLLRENRGTVTEGEGTLEPPLVLKSGVLSDFEDSDHFGQIKSANEEAKERKEAYEAEKERRKEARRAEKQKRRELRKAERAEWAETHGSDVLQDALEEGYDCQRRYVLERVAADYHDSFRVDFDKEASYSERSCPSEEALRFAQETGGEVVWLTERFQEQPDADAPRYFDEQEAVAKRVQIGEHGKSYTLYRLFS
jgi:hypothetical protein